MNTFKCLESLPKSRDGKCNISANGLSTEEASTDDVVVEALITDTCGFMGDLGSVYG